MKRVVIALALVCGPTSLANAITCSSTISPGADIQTEVNNTPSGGTLCLNSGTYSVAAAVTLDKGITVHGFNKPYITQKFNGNIFSITSSNVTISGLSMKGWNRNRTGDSCSGTGAISIGAVSNAKITNNNINAFTCGIMLSSSSGFTIKGNVLKNIKYAAITTYPASNGTIDQNTVTDLDNDGPYGENAYGIVLSGNVSRSITVSNNNVHNAHTWECYDTHDGQSISFLNNTCYQPGTVGINAGYSGVMEVTNIQIQGNTIDEGTLAAQCDAGANTHGCNSIVLTGTGQVINNTIGNYTGGYCNIYAPNATVSGNNCY